MKDAFLLTMRLYDLSKALMPPTSSVSHSSDRSAVIIAYRFPFASYNGFEYVVIIISPPPSS